MNPANAVKLSNYSECIYLLSHRPKTPYTIGNIIMTNAIENVSITTQISSAYVELNRLLDIIERSQLENTDILTRSITGYSEEWYINNARQILWATESAQTVREAIDYLQSTSLVDDFLTKYQHCLKSGKRPLLLYNHSLTRGHSFTRYIKNSKTFTKSFVKSLPTLKADEMYVFDCDSVA